jgi:hypothetical protein
MNKISMVSGVALALLCATTIWAAPPKSCSITCIEKTPDCYVSKDKDGCLIISDEKPKVNKEGKLICIIPGCEKETKY